MARGAAWATPTLVLAATAKPAAASTPPVVFNSDNSSVVCKVTKGEKKYRFTLSFTNTGTVAYTVCVGGATATPNGCPAVSAGPGTYCCTIAPGKTCKITVTTVKATCAAQGAMYLALTYTYTDATGTHTVSAAASWPAVNPC